MTDETAPTTTEAPSMGDVLEQMKAKVDETDDVPTPAPEPTPAPDDAPPSDPPAEPTPPSEPVYNVDDVRNMVRTALKRAQAQKDAEQFQRDMDALYEDNPAQYARVTRELAAVQKEREVLREDVAADYYGTVFNEFLAKYKPILVNLPPEKKAELNPENPKWQSDGQYLQALLSTVAEAEAEAKANARIEEYKKTQVANFNEVKDANDRAKNTVDLPPTSPTTSTKNIMEMGSREGLAFALKDVIGSKYLEDDSD